MKQSESQEQREFFKWVKIKANQDPEWENIIAVPNQGFRGGAQWGKSRLAEGLAPGFPDIAILVPRGPFHGAFIEFKVGRNVPTDNQLEWLKRLEKQDYFTAICVGLTDLINTTEKYYGLR